MRCGFAFIGCVDLTLQTWQLLTLLCSSQAQSDSFDCGCKVCAIGEPKETKWIAWSHCLMWISSIKSQILGTETYLCHILGIHLSG